MAPPSLKDDSTGTLPVPHMICRLAGDSSSERIRYLTPSQFRTHRTSRSENREKAEVIVWAAIRSD
jgi:hypothetical protein